MRTLKVWHCIGDMGEDSIESFHVRRNNMSRRYCQTRGAKRHEMILKALEFENAPWIHDGIQEMLDATKAKREPVVRRTRQEQQAEVIIEDEVEEDRRQDDQHDHGRRPQCALDRLAQHVPIQRFETGGQDQGGADTDRCGLRRGRKAGIDRADDNDENADRRQQMR